jgi:hypothetical protein
MKHEYGRDLLPDDSGFLEVEFAALDGVDFFFDDIGDSSCCRRCIKEERMRR